MRNFTLADIEYRNILTTTKNYGTIKPTRNSETYCNPFLNQIRFTQTPLVTLRRTAWKKALREMEWFLSGESKCPDDLLDWWEGQLNPDGRLIGGYGQQLRYSTFYAPTWDEIGSFDQIKFIQEGLKNNPNSRRLITSTWNPGEMANITEYNENPDTPTCCHGTLTQYFIIEDTLHATTYQRSADLLLGVPHNWIQYWGYMLWLAYHAGLKMGSLTWTFGDAHIYKEDSHLAVVDQILTSTWNKNFSAPQLIYTPTSTDFKASDFTLIGDIPEPVSKIRPKRL